MIKSIIAILLLLPAFAFAEIGDSIYGRGADSCNAVYGRMCQNGAVYGRQQEDSVFRGGQTYSEIAMSIPGLVAYWPLNGTLVELVSGNTASGTNSWTSGPHGQASLFNGTSQYLESTNAIDLTGTGAATVVLNWNPVVYDLTNEEVVFSFGTVASLATGFSLNTQGNIANDPLAAQVKGDVSYNYSRYNAATFGFTTPAWSNLAVIFDKTQSANETDLYINGSLATASSRVTNNNANAFGNLKMSIGSYFGSVFSNHAVEGFALYNRALTAKQISSIGVAR